MRGRSNSAALRKLFRSLSGDHGTWLVSGALIAALGLAQFRLANHARNLSVESEKLNPESEAVSGYLGPSLDPRIINRFLGLRLIASDLVWIDTLVKSDMKREGVPFTAFYKAFQTIVALDPDNLYAYYIGGLYLSVIKDDIKGATALLTDGARQAAKLGDAAPPNAWLVPFTLGYNLIFEEHEFDEGARWIQTAAESRFAPKYVVDLAKRVSTETGRLEVGSKVLLNFYKRVQNDEQRARIEKKLSEIAERQQLAELNDLYQKFLVTTHAYTLSKERAFSNFMRAYSYSRRDLLGRAIGIDETGRIVPLNELSLKKTKKKR